VLATNQGQSIEEQMNQMMAALQQKKSWQRSVTRWPTPKKRTNDVNASTSHNSPHPQPEITLKAIQRMISKGVRAQYMQIHHSMCTGYVKPYPPEVDMVPFPNNYH
jgi:hypothetical protein